MIFELKENGEVYMDGTLTEVLCVLDALDDEPKKEPKKELKTRAEYVREFQDKFDDNTIFNFLGRDSSIVVVSRDFGVYKNEAVFHFSDGSELKLKC